MNYQGLGFFIPMMPHQYQGNPHISNHVQQVFSPAPNALNYMNMNMNMNSIETKHIKHKFTPEEDERLSVIVGKCGESNWKRIAEQMGTRNCRQCRERWKNYLCPNVCKEPWTKEEDELLQDKYKELGSQWSIIAKFFPSRTDVNVKNRWVVLTNHTVQEKRVRRKSSNKDNNINNNNDISSSNELSSSSSYCSNTCSPKTPLSETIETERPFNNLWKPFDDIKTTDVVSPPEAAVCPVVAQEMKENDDFTEINVLSLFCNEEGTNDLFETDSFDFFKF